MVVVVDDVVVVVDEVVVLNVVVDELVVEDAAVVEDELLLELDELELDEDDVVVPPPPAAGNRPTPLSEIPPLVVKSPTAARFEPSVSTSVIPATPFVVGRKSGSSTPSLAFAAIIRSDVFPL